jgi:hypothetical protein
VSDIIYLPGNPIGRADRERLESFGGRTVAHGRATRWRWGRTADGDQVFELRRGGGGEELLARIRRDRVHDVYRVQGAGGGPIATGLLDQVLAELDWYLARIQRDRPDPVA